MHTAKRNQIDLERYNPDQFNVSFSFSQESLDDMMNPSHSALSSNSQIDDDLHEELDTIDFVLQKINTQLSFKDLILRSAVRIFQFSNFN